MGRAIALSEPSIGRRYRGDAGQSQLLRQPILQRRKARSERPRLGRIARDVADAELRQRARPAFAGSSTPPPRPWACGNSGRDRCRAHKTARAGRSPRPARESSTPCPPPRDQTRIDRAGRILEGDHQIGLPVIARQPGKARGVPRFREGRLSIMPTIGRISPALCNASRVTV